MKHEVCACMRVCTCVCVHVMSSIKIVTARTALEEAVCFTSCLHPKDAKPVPEGQSSPANSNELGLWSFHKGRGRQSP